MSSDIHVSFACERLSEAQRTILIHRTLGRDLKTIARLMNYTEGTITQYLNRARERLHARNNEEACWLARFYGQISDAEILIAYTVEQALDGT